MKTEQLTLMVGGFLLFDTSPVPWLAMVLCVHACVCLCVCICMCDEECNHDSMTCECQTFEDMNWISVLSLARWRMMFAHVLLQIHGVNQNNLSDHIITPMSVLNLVRVCMSFKFYETFIHHTQWWLQHMLRMKTIGASTVAPTVNITLNSSIFVCTSIYWWTTEGVLESSSFNFELKNCYMESVYFFVINLNKYEKS